MTFVRAFGNAMLAAVCLTVSVELLNIAYIAAAKRAERK